MDVIEALKHVERTVLTGRLSGQFLLAALLRAAAKQQDDPGAFLAAIRADAQAELEAARFSTRETSDDSQLREDVRVEIDALVRLAGAAPPAERSR